MVVRSHSIFITIHSPSLAHQVFQADKSSAPAAKSSSAAAPAPKAPKAKKAESSSEGGLSLDPRTVALPCTCFGDV